MEGGGAPRPDAEEQPGVSSAADLTAAETKAATTAAAAAAARNGPSGDLWKKA